MILITGSTGHIGNNLVEELVKRKYSVKLFMHSRESEKTIAPFIRDLNVEKVYGNILHKESIVKALEGVSIVIHLAAIVTILPDNKKSVTRSNVSGTKNVVEACKEMKIKKLIHISSIHALRDMLPGIAIDESIPVDPEKAIGHYGKTKAKGTKYVLDAFEKGQLNGCVIHPTGVIGVNDYKFSLMGRTIVAMAKNTLFAGIGAYDFVDVKDVVKGIILVLEKGKNGERYIISGTQISIKNLKYMIDDILGRKKFAISLPRFILKIGVFFIGIGYFLSKIVGIKMVPLLTADSEYILFSNSNISSAKIKSIGYTVTPIRKTIEETLAWHRQQEHIK